MDIYRESIDVILQIKDNQTNIINKAIIMMI